VGMTKESEKETKKAIANESVSDQEESSVTTPSDPAMGIDSMFETICLRILLITLDFLALTGSSNDAEQKNDFGWSVLTPSTTRPDASQQSSTR
jgi:hypothetical protein